MPIIRELTSEDRVRTMNTDQDTAPSTDRKRIFGNLWYPVSMTALTLLAGVNLVTSTSAGNTGEAYWWFNVSMVGVAGMCAVAQWVIYVKLRNQRATQKQSAVADTTGDEA